MPQYAYSTSSFRILSTMYCEFRPIGGVSWTQFKVLSIGHAALSNEIIAEVLVESPLLESLKLQSCDGVNEIIVNSSKI